MSNNSIKLERILDSEIDAFALYGVSIEETGISFSRRLSQEEFRQVLGLLISMQSRMDNSKENNINWAIGDCLNTAIEWFGEDCAYRISEEVVAFFPKRDRLLLFASSVLIFIQSVERLIKLCCSGLNVGLSVDDLLSNNQKCQSATMGKLRCELKRRKLFTPEYETELQEFVQDRNCFVHDLWTVKLPQLQESDPDTDEIVLCGRFIRNLLHKAQKCERIFKGLLISLGAQLPEVSSGVFAESSILLRYAQEFKDVKRGSEDE